MQISIIIVNYKVGKKVFKCIESVFDSISNLELEIIVVDNEGDKSLEKRIKTQKNVKYINTGKNLGFGGGNNLGVKHAKGKYLFFLNPDTLVKKDTINSLYNFLVNNHDAGAVSPLLVDVKGNVFKTQSKRSLTPLSAVFSFSFLRKIFKNKNIYNDKEIEKINLKDYYETEAVPGAAFMILSEVFKKIGEFDEKLFLYFEENDLSKRLKNNDYKLYILPQAKVVHAVGESTKQLADREQIFAKSRFYYLRKHFGLFKATLSEGIIRLNKYSLLLFVAIIAGIFLRFLNLQNGMAFIGDQGWFYMSARDMLIFGKIPLVGITSSHLWLHQGPIWTYMLSIMLFIFKFNPFSGAYLTIFLGLLTIVLIYKIGKDMFNKNLGIIASLLYAVSPLIVLSDRMPFDPSPIPTVTLIYFYSIYKWLRGKMLFFPLIILCMTFLYNLELATFSIFLPFLAIFAFGIIKNKIWINMLKTPKIIISSILAFIIPMLPIFIYDFNNGFKQTVVFGGWIVYKALSIFFVHGTSNVGILEVINFIVNNTSAVILPLNNFVSGVILIVCLAALLYLSIRRKLISESLLSLFLVVGLFGILINKTPSSAYFPILFPFLILAFAYLINLLTLKYKILYIILALIIGINFYFSRQNIIRLDDYKMRLNAVNKIITLTQNNKFNLVGVGSQSQFESFLDNYEYLLWWKGHPVSKTQEKIKLFLREDKGQIYVNKKEL